MNGRSSGYFSKYDCLVLAALIFASGGLCRREDKLPLIFPFGAIVCCNNFSLSWAAGRFSQAARRLAKWNCLSEGNASKFSR